MIVGAWGKRFGGLCRFTSYGSVVTGGFLSWSQPGPNGKAPQGEKPDGPTITVDIRYALSAPASTMTEYRW
jgi:hypothetical protein